MSPQFALFACTALVLVALVADARRYPTLSVALWVPVIWVTILASRPFAQWLNPSVGAFGTDPADGNPLDRNILTAMILIAALVLIKRRIDWRRWRAENRWVIALFAYFALSVFWSDFPDIAIKRFFRAIGSLLIILVVLSEEDPVAAIVAVIRRTAFILIPLSVVLVKYYRSLGVGYNSWTGEEYFAGATTDKNALGRLCLTAGLIYVWTLISPRDAAPDSRARPRLLHQLLLLTNFGLTLWMLMVSKSSTSLACFILGASVLVLFSRARVRRQARFLGTWAVAAALAAWVAYISGLPEVIVTALGRDMTLTDRVFIWADLLAANTNAVFGVGYGSFWLGPRLDYFIAVHQVNESHSGYLDVYVELGFVGAFIFIGVLLKAFFDAKRSLQEDPSYGSLRIAILFVFLAYNITESAYPITTLLAFLFFLLSIMPPRRARSDQFNASGMPGTR